MMRKACLIAALAPILPFLLGVPPAAAQHETVGTATVAINAVTGRLDDETRAIGEGAFVYRDERVATARDSRARLSLTDGSQIALGPNATVTLDRFVAVGAGSASDVALYAARGALRFVSGRSGSPAYQIRTPHATIGVRGTVFDVLVSPTQTRVQLVSGAIIVCPTQQPCRVVARPGDLVTVASNGAVTGPSPGSSSLFGPYCTGGLCGGSGQTLPGRDPASSAANGGGGASGGGGGNNR